MTKLLAVDIGNTNITVGIFKGTGLLGKVKIPTNSYSSYIRLIKKLIKDADVSVDRINEVIISSVVPLALARLIVELRRMGIFKITIFIQNS